jgi:hypothetical protein
MPRALGCRSLQEREAATSGNPRDLPKFNRNRLRGFRVVTSIARLAIIMVRRSLERI